MTSDNKDPVTQLSKYLKLYCDKNVMTAIGRGSYKVNPAFCTSYMHFNKALIVEEREYAMVKSQVAVKKKFNHIGEG